jgi:hypothetical protein
MRELSSPLSCICLTRLAAIFFSASDADAIASRV